MRPPSDQSRTRRTGLERFRCRSAGEDFHQLRHLYASVLIRAGGSVKTLQMRLGHISAQMTLDAYSHQWPELPSSQSVLSFAKPTEGMRGLTCRLGTCSEVRIPKVASRPVGGVLYPASRAVVIHLSGLPGDIGRAARPALGLAPGGVYRAVRVTPAAGALLPHRFTLACARSPGHRRSALCCTFLRVAPTGC